MEKKIALITGANRGIGKEICRQLVLRDWQIVVASRKLEAAKKVCEQIGHEAFPVQFDVSDQGSVMAAAETVREKFGKLDVLVNNAAIMGNASMHSFELTEIADAMNTNFMGPVRTSKYFMPLLKKSADARIINLSSGMGELSSLQSGGYGAYRLSKTSLNAFTILLASELQHDSIKAGFKPIWVAKAQPGPLKKEQKPQFGWLPISSLSPENFTAIKR